MAARSRKNKSDTSRAAWLGNIAQWSSAIAAILAIVISSVTAYYTILRTYDDLRVVLGFVLPEPRVSGHFLFVRADHDITFINAGNRAVALRGMRVVISDSKPDWSRCPLSGKFINYDVDPFIIAPGEIKLKHVKLSEFQPMAVIENGEAKTDFENLQNRRFMICILFDVITADNFLEEIGLPTMTISLPDKDWKTRDILFDPRKAQPLLAN